MWIWCFSLFKDCIATCPKLTSVDWRGRACIWLVTIARLRSWESVLFNLTWRHPFVPCSSRSWWLVRAQQDAVVWCGAGGPAGSSTGEGAQAACLASHSSGSSTARRFARNILNSVLGYVFWSNLDCQLLRDGDNCSYWPSHPGQLCFHTRCWPDFWKDLFQWFFRC